MFVGYKKSNNRVEILKEALFKKENTSHILYNNKEIINYFVNQNWIDTDLNTHVVLWNSDYQLLLGEFLDAVCGGVASYLPSEWGDPYAWLQSRESLELDPIKFAEMEKKINNFTKIFSEWVEKHNNAQANFEFIDWYLKNYDINK